MIGWGMNESFTGGRTIDTGTAILCVEDLAADQVELDRNNVLAFISFGMRPTRRRLNT